MRVVRIEKPPARRHGDERHDLMQLRYDDDFVEGAVFVRANSRQTGPPSLQIRRFHGQREKLYAILDPDERNAAFFELHLDWFREWGLEKMLLNVADEFPLLRTALAALIFRKARVKKDEGAELYVQTGSAEAPAAVIRSAVVALRAERFERPEELAGFLRHELMHVHDMVNPAFGYSPQLHLPGQNAAQQRLTRERYRLLWDITIDGRLSVAADVRRRTDSQPHEAPPPHVGSYLPGSREQHRAAFEQAFGFWPELKRDEVFDALWNNPDPRHDDLLAIAADPRDIKSALEPTPGAPCPLCGFATFDWAEIHTLSQPTFAAIQREFPRWAPEEGACGRCVEIYRIVAAQRCALAEPGKV
jgi:hypothetical protein